MLKITKMTLSVQKDTKNYQNLNFPAITKQIKGRRKLKTYWMWIIMHIK